MPLRAAVALHEEGSRLFYEGQRSNCVLPCALAAHSPAAGPWDEAVLDGPAHRALAREAVSRSTVLLENRNGSALPLPRLPPRIAVIGPFSHCTNLDGGYGSHDQDDGNYTCVGTGSDVFPCATAAARLTARWRALRNPASATH